jgi:hypothetical protein
MIAYLPNWCVCGYRKWVLLQQWDQSSLLFWCETPVWLDLYRDVCDHESLAVIVCDVSLIVREKLKLKFLNVCIF